jgi:conserved domain protein
MFAGSGRDSVMNPGSLIFLFQEARGNNKQYSKTLLKENRLGVSFGSSGFWSDKFCHLRIEF